MWENQGTNPISWGKPIQVAGGVGVLARDVQFAATNDDGKLYYVVVNRINGSVWSWHNLGVQSDGSIHWGTPVSFADGTGSSGFAIKVSRYVIAIFRDH
jgi:hypothetical protein